MQNIRIAPGLSSLIICALFCLTASAAELARWQASSSLGVAERIRLERVPDSEWHVEKVGTREVARLTPSTDLYTRAAYHFSVDPIAVSNCWVVLEFLDQGYGLISLSPGVPQSKQWGTARVNSGRLRRAVFQFEPTSPQRLRIEGLDFLCAVIVNDSQPLLEQVPLVEPAVKFVTPSERVTFGALESSRSKAA